MPPSPDSSPSERRRRVLVLWGPAALYAAAIFVESSISRVPEFPSGFTDKDGHALLYAGLAVLIVRALCGASWNRVTVSTTAAAVVLAALYGASDEFHQWFVPGRTADVFDWMADTIGATVAVAGLWLVARVARNRG